jgi:hypothetical protein
MMRHDNDDAELMARRRVQRPRRASPTPAGVVMEIANIDIVASGVAGQ